MERHSVTASRAPATRSRCCRSPGVGNGALHVEPAGIEEQARVVAQRTEHEQHAGIPRRRRPILHRHPISRGGHAKKRRRQKRRRRPPSTGHFTRQGDKRSEGELRCTRNSRSQDERDFPWSKASTSNETAASLPAAPRIAFFTGSQSAFHRAQKQQPGTEGKQGGEGCPPDPRYTRPRHCAQDARPTAKRHEQERPDRTAGARQRPRGGTSPGSTRRSSKRAETRSSCE